MGCSEWFFGRSSSSETWCVRNFSQVNSDVQKWMGAHTYISGLWRKSGTVNIVTCYCLLMLNILGIISNQRNAKKNTALKGELFVKCKTINSCKLCTPVKLGFGSRFIISNRIHKLQRSFAAHHGLIKCPDNSLKSLFLIIVECVARIIRRVMTVGNFLTCLVR